MGRVEHIHFVGIGGAGMCGIAEVLRNEGYTISGSDLSENIVIDRLRTLGITVNIGHHESNIKGADVVVRSTAVLDTNPEIVSARQLHTPVIPRAAMLAELMRFRQGIAVAGTHGKTTTTSLVSSLLAEGGFDPSFVIGGKLNSCGTNAQLGKSPYFVAEADESDASFLFLKPMISIVTNIDADHMETYDDNFDKLRDTFIEFLHHLPFYGLAVLCIDDSEVKQLLPRIQRPIRTYGFDSDAQYRAIDWTQEGLWSQFTVQRPKPFSPLTIRFQWPGRHNVQNALAAIVIATELGVSDEAIVAGLKNFQGVGRRFQLVGECQFTKGPVTIVDDYGHHPNEIKTTLDAFRRVWPTKRLIHVFQPHRYSRTKALFKDFVSVLSESDKLILLDIYPAGELPIPGVTSQALFDELKRHNVDVVYADKASLVQILDDIVESGDVVLMQGAGSVGQMAINLVEGSN